MCGEPEPNKPVQQCPERRVKNHAANVFQVATMSPNMDPESVVAQLRKEHDKFTLRYMIAARDPLHAVLVERERQLEE